MFNLGPMKLPNNYAMIIKHIGVMRRLLKRLEEQVWDADLGELEETFGHIRERSAWIGDAIEEALAMEQWVEDRAMLDFYGKEIFENMLRRREEREREKEERKRGGTAT